MDFSLHISKYLTDGGISALKQRMLVKNEGIKSQSYRPCGLQVMGEEEKFRLLQE